MPRSLRSSVTIREAAIDRVRGRRERRRSPSSAHVARRGRCAPTIASATDVRPAPTSPASPTISPSRTVKRDVAKAPRRAERLRTSSAARARRRRRAPEIPRTRRGPPSSGSAAARSRPAAAAVATWPAVPQHGHAIGDREDLVEPVRDVDDAEPAVAQLAHDRRSRRVDFARRQASPRARRGSSTRASRSSARAISTIC